MMKMPDGKGQTSVSHAVSDPPAQPVSAATSAVVSHTKTRPTGSRAVSKAKAKAKDGAESSQGEGRMQSSDFDRRRRRAAHVAMMRLLEQGAPNEDDLERIAAPLSGSEFLQVQPRGKAILIKPCDKAM
jgi:hypothetical protein